MKKCCVLIVSLTPTSSIVPSVAVTLKEVHLQTSKLVKGSISRILSRSAAHYPVAPTPAFVLQTSFLVRFKKSKSKGKSSSPGLENLSSLPFNLTKYENNMKKTFDALQNSYSRLRVDGATPAILDDVSVKAYGTETPLKNIAQVGVRDGRALIVQVFDESTTNAVEKAIRSAGLNLNPVRESDGRLKVPVPRSSKQTRDSMKDNTLKEAEAAKIATRMIRRKAMEEVKNLKGEVSKDDIKKIEKGVQALTDRFIGDIAEVQRSKLSAIEALQAPH